MDKQLSLSEARAVPHFQAKAKLLITAGLLAVLLRGGFGEEPGGLLWKGQDVQLTALVEYVSKYLGKRFIYDSDLLAGKRIALVMNKRIPREKVYKVFRTILGIHGFVLVEYEDYTRIESGKRAKLLQTGVMGKNEARLLRDEDRMITRVFTLKNAEVNAASAMVQRLLDPEMEQAIAVPDSNTIVVTGLARNLERVEKALEAVDMPGPELASEIVVLKHAKATDAAKFLVPLARSLVQTRKRHGTRASRIPLPQVLSVDNRNAVLLSGTAEEVQLLKNLLQQVDVPGPELQVEVMELRHAWAPDLLSQLAPVLKKYAEEHKRPGPKRALPAPQATADSRTNSLVLLGTRDELTELKTVVTKLDVVVEELETAVKVFPVRNVKADELKEVLEKILGSQGEVTGKNGKEAKGTPAVRELEMAVQGSSLVVRSSRKVLDRVGELIKELDVRRPKVLIEAAIVELTTDRDFNLGVELATIDEPGRNIRPFAGTNVGLTELRDTDGDGVADLRVPLPTEGLIAGAFKHEIGKIPIILKALERKSRVRVLAAPMVVADDDQEATFRSSDQFPVATFTTTQSTTDVTSFGGFQDAVIELVIKPNINVEEGYLRLEIKQKVEVFKGSPTAPNLPPRKDSREVTAVVTVPDGRMVVIGGLSNNRVERERTGVPILHKIPVLGFLFRGQGKRDVETRLYAFVSPRILKDLSFEDYERLSKQHHDEIEKFMKDEKMPEKRRKKRGRGFWWRKKSQAREKEAVDKK